MNDLSSNEAKEKQSAALLRDLKQQIVQGEILPGHPIPSQRQLAECYGVARSTAREASFLLEAQGLIAGRPGAVGRVCNLLAPHMTMPLEGVGDHPEFQLQVLEVRATLEGEAAWYAAQRASDDELMLLAQEYQRMQQRSRTGQTTLEKAKADLRFHMMIAEASHHLLIISFSQIFYERYFNAIYGVLNRTLIRYGRYPDGIRAQHASIHQALQQRDAASARVAAREHILYTRRQLENVE